MQTASEKATNLLGANCITPHMVESSIGLPYEEECLHRLESDILPDAKLMRMKASNYMLIPGPPAALSLSDMYAMNPDWFRTSRDPWFANEDFYTEPAAHCKWLALGQETLSKSYGKSFMRQKELLLRDEMVPKVAEVVWAMVVLNEVLGVRFLNRTQVRTFSRAKGDQHVDCGNTALGVTIRAYLGERGLSNIGMVPKLRLAA
ncbi:hypothetical protein COB52_01570 [Candidatus Kaiserbacteria bacterium]|nr:MAG: hypothetical protein COB52_01570 [Candidatus Kaiserbacteria bacterium]